MLTRLAVDMVKQLGGQEQVEYITFDFDAGILVSQLSPDSQVAYLNGDKTPLEAKNAGFTGIDYNMKAYRENPQWIQQAQQQGLGVNVWTVNSQEDLTEFIQKGVDFITTNEPERLIEILDTGL